MFDHYMNGLKAVPFKEFSFSATCVAISAKSLLKLRLFIGLHLLLSQA